ncbi:MAG: EscD/YscD/HrpQ family type III secretion system inner membrane ring protein [Chlamydiales bacterium]|nr:EscD/YscD/HrpQ family type III secretion system inner membrane ring protein [Chlamydiales bacterium]
MTVKLVSISDSEKDLSLSKEEQAYFIGRDPEQSQLLIADPKVSRKHAQITYSSSGFSIRNLSQTNPIFVNDEAIEEDYSLKQGDKIKIGDSVFHFFDEEAASSSPIQQSENDDDENPYETIFEEFSDFGDDTDINFTESQRFLLKVLTGPNTGAEFPLEEGKTYTIGTDTHECDVIFHDLSVSRKHATLSLSEDGTITVTDLDSRNGILVDGQNIQGSKEVKSNELISLGTSTFTVLDYENNSETIISPQIPNDQAIAVEEKEVSLEEINQKQEEKVSSEIEDETADEDNNEEVKEPEETPPTPTKKSWVPVTLIVGALLFFTVLNIGISLFKTEEVSAKKIDEQEEIRKALVHFEKVEFSYRKNSGELFLQGHVLDSVEKNQLLYQLQALKYISSIEDYIIIDELIAKEHNEIFSKRAEWKGITIQTPKPGRFIITGYLETAAQAEALAEYINRHFDFVDLLENRVAVEDLVILSVDNKFLEKFPNFKDVRASLVNGELKLEGMIKAKDKRVFDHIMDEIKELRGIRKINNYVVEVQESETVIDISRKYNVTGYSQHDNISINVIVNGRIVSRGDQLEGMTITSILPHTILLEKDGLKYKIDYKK